jgi:UDP-N-acetylmuramyl tripeptide synthase
LYEQDKDEATYERVKMNGGMMMFYKKRRKSNLFDYTLTAVSTGAIAYLMTKSMRENGEKDVDSRQDLSDMQGK